MHATVEQLLSFRDGVGTEAALGEHIAQCPRCRAAVDDLVALREELKDLRDVAPPGRTWENIRSRVPEVLADTVAARRHPWVIGLAACLALVIGVLLTAARQGSLPPPPTDSAAETSGSTPHRREDLLARSREMEAFLRRLPARPQVVRVGTAATIAELEESIRMVDYQLNLESQFGLTQSQSQRLWETRVDLLNSLANVRYVEAQRQIY